MQTLYTYVVQQSSVRQLHAHAFFSTSCGCSFCNRRNVVYFLAKHEPSRVSNGHEVRTHLVLDIPRSSEQGLNTPFLYTPHCPPRDSRQRCYRECSNSTTPHLHPASALPKLPSVPTFQGQSQNQGLVSSPSMP